MPARIPPDGSYFSLSLLFWRIYKWFLHLVTGQCELQRLCTEFKDDMAERTANIAECLRFSRHEDLRRLAAATSDDQDLSDKDKVTDLVLRVKKIKREDDPEFVCLLEPCLLPVVALSAMKEDVERLREEAYDKGNSRHEKLLVKLWALLMPNDELKERCGKHWDRIGFQGTDPATDFRGMGMLGLHCMLYFAELHNKKCRQTLSQSHHPQLGYPWAITNINITSITYHLLTDDNELDYYLYNCCNQRIITLNDFMEMHCYFMYEFNKRWFESEAVNIMGFSKVRDKFVKSVQESLKGRPLDINLIVT